MKRTVMFGAGAMMLAAAMAALPAAAGAAPVEEQKNLLVSEPFTGAEVAEPDLTSLDACLTAATDTEGENGFGSCEDQNVGPVPEAGASPGYLQLTDTGNYDTGALIYNQALENEGGIEVTFAQYQYGGSGADGISFFLVDGETDLTETGAFGGSLGYAQRETTDGDMPATQPGVDGGYLGLGLDSWGNFSADTEGRGNGCADDQQAPEHLRTEFNRAPDSVALRGPGQGNEGYCLLATTATDEFIDSDANGDLYGTSVPESLNADSLESAKRLVKLKVSGDEQPTVTVDMQFLGAEEAAGDWQRVLETTMPTAAPETFKFGLASSTGGATDVHLLRHLRVETFG